MQIILISGKAEAGKTTTAKILKDELEKDYGKKVLLTNYAGTLKFICKNFFDWNGEKDEAGRALLQRIGTDIVRKKDPDFWVNFMKSVLELFYDEWDCVLIDDVRFENEISLIKSAFDCVTTLRIERPNYLNHLTFEQRQHPSETSLDNFKFDFTILNPGDDRLKTLTSIFLDKYAVKG